jgi:hypothetical protein
MFLDDRKNPFGVGLSYVPSTNANLTCKVQHTFDSLRDFKHVYLSRSTTTATLLYPNHGLSVGDYVNVQRAPAPFAGEFTVAGVTDENNITYTVANSGATAARGDAILARLFDHDFMTAMTTSKVDGNYAFPPEACRLLCSSYTAGYADLLLIQAG